jgi:cobyrinic acid a,c-diamide synthase
MLREALPPSIRWLGAIPRKLRMALPERHLGLVQAQEVDDLEQKIAQAATYFEGTVLAELPPAVPFHPVETESVPRLLEGVRIAIAQDKAFSFLYPANLELLGQMGAELSFFSPLVDSALPEADAIYLPGGYPELHLETLAANHGLKQALRAHVAAGKPLYAECGGMLYLVESLTDGTGKQADMLGLLPGQARLHDKVAGLGLQWVELDEGVLRGHTFHYSSLSTMQPPWTRAVKAIGGNAGEAVYRKDSLIASYLHLYFPSNPQAAAALFKR